MNRARTPIVLIGCLMLISALAVPTALAGEAAKSPVKLKLMGINRTLDPWKLFEEWAHSVEKRSNGRVQFEFTSLP
jgi:TRAP-type C4-dicarboxylate transport system substrate-binding protein